MADYTSYVSYLDSIYATNSLTDFKSNSRYRQILEHVSNEQGKEYLDYILSLTLITKEEILKFCTLNDSLGNPYKNKYDILNISVSPTSLRYIFHAHLILTQIKATGNLNVDIVEVGGGYGGLCLCLYYFASNYKISINSYRICDLPSVIRLQKMYLSTVNSTLEVEFVDSTTHGSAIDCDTMFLISNYCFSEISKENQDSYRKTLFPKVAHGFMAWNMIPVYDFGFSTRVESEFPNTGGPMNKYVYF
jgi:hypothetical protein